jgi:FkbM family methyltransferase
MMCGVPAPTFESFAQNGEDVVLWRALGSVPEGRYIDVGANHPSEFSISWPFYRRGWHGLTVEPVRAFAAMHREQRPRDTVIEAAITSDPGKPVVLYEIPDTGLSTLVDDVRAGHEQAGWRSTEVLVETRSLDEVLAGAGWQDSDIHFMTIDTEGTEGDVLRSIDLRVWRPWVLVVEATAPLSTIPTHQEWEGIVAGAGYQFCMFDGVSRFYVAREHAHLAPKLSYPACPLDDYTTLRYRQLEAEVTRVRESLQQATEDVVRWRAAALIRWTDAVADNGQPGQSAEVENLRRELVAMRGTVSWRLTKPLRMVRKRVGPGGTDR